MGDRFDLTGKVVWVVGGTGAIGQAMARGCAEQGASVAISGRSEQDAVQVADSLGAASVCGVAIDLADIESIQWAADAVVARLGAIDVLINAAGTHIESPSTEVTPEDWDRVLDINLRGAMFLSQAAAKAMIGQGQGGSIVHVTSVRSALGIRRGYAAYVASKGGLAMLIKQLASEWAAHGIRVNGIAPTFTRTPLVEPYLSDPAFYQALVARIPMGRVCETDDLVGAAIFFAADASRFVTGQNMFIDGGLSVTQ